MGLGESLALLSRIQYFARAFIRLSRRDVGIGMHVQNVYFDLILNPI